MKFKSFHRWLANEAEQMTSKEVNDYIADLTPSDSDIPDYYMELIRKSGKKFTLKTVLIEELLKNDPSLAEYVKSGEVRYGEGGVSELEPRESDLEYPIVVFNGEVIDGYSRTSTLYHRGEKTIQAWVSE